MKEKTLTLLKRLSTQRLQLQQQELLNMQNQRDVYVLEIEKLREKIKTESLADCFVVSSFFDCINDEKNRYKNLIIELEQGISQQKQIVIDAWQRDEILKMVPEKNNKL